MNKTMTIAALFSIALGGAALADALTDKIVADLSAQGYERIEITQGISQTKVEAIRGTEKLEQVFDRTSGEVIEEETEAVESDDDTTPGVSMSQKDRDFVDEADEMDDDEDDEGDDDDDEDENDDDDDDDEDDEDEEDDD